MSQPLSFYDPEQCRNESEVESKFIIQYLLPALGYSAESWHQEVTFGGIRLDFLAVAANLFRWRAHLLVIVEAKHPQQNLEHHTRKFRRYLKTLNVRYGLLTNGRQVRIYESTSSNCDDFYLRLEVAGQEVPTRLLELKQWIGREELQQRSISMLQPIRSLPLLLPPSASSQETIELGEHDHSPQLQSQTQVYDQFHAQPNAQSKTQLQSQLEFEFLPQTLFDPQSTQQETRSMQVITIYHNKGGVGKTTTVINLAAALSRQKKRVLVIDLDSQANTTFAAGLVKFQDELTDTIKDNYVYHVILEKNRFPIAEVARTSDFTKPPFDVVPSHINLMEHENELIQLPPALTRLVKKLEEVQDRYDIVLIDTPPSLNLYARIALTASDYLLIPSDLRPFSNEGLRNVRRFINDINEFRETIGKKHIQILGVLPSKLPTYAKFVESTLPRMAAIVEQQYGFSLLKSRIFERRDVSAAIERTIEVGDLDIPDPTSIFDYKPDSQASEEFENLAREVMDLIQASA